jgi:hypothetical protein
VAAAALTAEITNPLFPAPVSARWVYEADTAEGLERIDVAVEAETYDVWGTTARVARDTVFLDGEMIEDSPRSAACIARSISPARPRTSPR